MSTSPNYCTLSEWQDIHNVLAKCFWSEIAQNNGEGVVSVTDVISSLVEVIDGQHLIMTQCINLRVR